MLLRGMRDTSAIEQGTGYRAIEQGPLNSYFYIHYILNYILLLLLYNIMCLLLNSRLFSSIYPSVPR